MKIASKASDWGDADCRIVLQDVRSLTVHLVVLRSQCCLIGHLVAVVIGMASSSTAWGWADAVLPGIDVLSVIVHLSGRLDVVGCRGAVCVV